MESKEPNRGTKVAQTGTATPATEPLQTGAPWLLKKIAENKQLEQENAPLLVREIVISHVRPLVTEKEKTALRQIAAKLAEQRNIIHDHSPSVWEGRAKEAADRYASDPSAENLSEIRKHRSLTAFDHGQVQFIASQRRDKILREELPSVAAPIYKRAAEALSGRLSSISEKIRGCFSEFNREPAVSHLERELARIVLNWESTAAALSKADLKHASWDEEFLDPICENGPVRK